MLKISILLLVLLLSACGTPDGMISQGAIGDTATAMPAFSPSPVVAAISHDIARLLRKRPAPGEQVELDVYNWAGNYREASYDWDSQRCPTLATKSLLTDQPIAGFINYVNSGHTNWLLTYPSDSEPWLVPMFAAQKILAYPPPDEQAANPRNLGYRLRVRGHLDDPYFGHCAHADRIFVIDQVVTIYAESDPNPASAFDITLPADFPQWQRFSAPGSRLHFPRRVGWAIAPMADPAAREAFQVRMPEWPEHPVSIRVLDAPPARAQPSDGNGIPLDQAFLRQRLKLPENGQVFTGESLIEDVDAYTKSCTVVLTRGDTTYELKVSYPVGLHADRDLLLAFTALVAGFEVDQ